MPRFFRQADDSDSDTEESDEELLTSGDEEAPKKPAAKPTGMSRFLRTAGSDSSSSETESESEEESDAESGKKKRTFLRNDSEHLLQSRDSRLCPQ
jgi:translation initiation factor 3 subunit C